MRVAIIGSGISGSLVARLLSTRHDVSIFEADSYPGGHANTVEVSAFGKHYRVDTGFMVFNHRTYPNFCRLLDFLKIESQPSEMSFSVRCSGSGLEYQGSSLDGLFTQRLNCVRPAFLRMLRDILRFNRRGIAAASSGELKDGRTVGEFLQECGVGNPFVEQYLVPMAAAIWSARPHGILDFPAGFMIGFFANHGLMQIRDRPQWRTIKGGSRNYVSALLRPLENELRLNCPIASILRTYEGVWVLPVDGVPEFFDEVVFATHADQTLKMLADSTPSEQQILSAFPFHSSEAVLHTDKRLLPKHKRAWASWNYHIRPGNVKAASVTYDLSRLQKHDSPNIAAHYDLSNEFFSLMLDPTMTYSSGVFHSPATSLEDASTEKYDRICRKLQLRPTDHVLEIGTGWGGFAEHAAANYGCRITTTTISDQQHSYAARRFANASLDGRITLPKEDYRELRGKKIYDKLVSIEMIEAVGEKYLPGFFAKCSQLLRDNGMMLLQAITIPDHRYDHYRRSLDFIQHYIFPGGFLPSMGKITECLRLATNLTLYHSEDFGTHYARTLENWRRNFWDQIAEVRVLGFDERFIRMWNYYLSMSEAGFQERYTGVSQILLTKPLCRRSPLVVPLSGSP